MCNFYVFLHYILHSETIHLFVWLIFWVAVSAEIFGGFMKDLPVFPNDAHHNSIQMNSDFWGDIMQRKK